MLLVCPWGAPFKTIRCNGSIYPCFSAPLQVLLTMFHSILFIGMCQNNITSVTSRVSTPSLKKKHHEGSIKSTRGSLFFLENNDVSTTSKYHFSYILFHVKSNTHTHSIGFLLLWTVGPIENYDDFTREIRDSNYLLCVVSLDAWGCSPGWHNDALGNSSVKLRA